MNTLLPLMAENNMWRGPHILPFDDIQIEDVYNDNDAELLLHDAPFDDESVASDEYSDR